MCANGLQGVPPAVLAIRERIAERRERARRLADQAWRKDQTAFNRWYYRYGMMRWWTWRWSDDRWLEEARKRGVIE